VEEYHLLAEINNKISSSGSNLTERLEDNLTGNFFGAIRYLPFEVGLKNVLTSVRFNEDIDRNEWGKSLSKIHDYDLEYQFWTKHNEGEIDLLIVHQEVLIGIEVKLFSGLSSDDDNLELIEDPAESNNQLVRYAMMLNRIGTGVRKHLIFLAPLQYSTIVEQAMRSRSIIPNNLALGFISWEEVLESLFLIEHNKLEKGQQLILSDLKNLLLKKEFTRFSGFDLKSTKNIETNGIYRFKAGKRIGWNWPTKYIGGMGYAYKK
jgi:hypothetical protein